MSAIIELRKYCENHPEIRGHKEVGRLLQIAEFEQNDIMQKVFAEATVWTNQVAELRIDNARLKALVDEISVLITQFKKARNTTRSIEAIAKMVVWNVEQEDRIGKEKRDAGEVV